MRPSSSEHDSAEGSGEGFDLRASAFRAHEQDAFGAEFLESVAYAAPLARAKKDVYRAALFLELQLVQYAN